MILAFDIGIKHLAYCLLNDNNKIEKWELINLIKENKILEHKCYDCDCVSKFLGIKNSCGKHINKLIIQNIKCEDCGKIPKYFINNKFYCKKHKIDESEDIKKYIEIEKKKFINLKETKICQKKIKNRNCKCKVKFIKENKFYCNRHKPRDSDSIDKKNANKIDPSILCLKMCEELDKREYLLKANKVVIENQLAKTNPKMAILQGNIMTYFVMKGLINKSQNNSNIETIKPINATNKLKVYKGERKIYKLKCKKNIRKKIAIDDTLSLLNERNEDEKWKEYFKNNKKKQDDLADAYLYTLYVSQEN